MALEHVPRCQHVKVNGVQCGSPALRRKTHCYFHTRVEHERRAAAETTDGKRSFGFPLLEDAKSIQVALMKMVQMLGAGTLDHKTAGLMIYALQTASYNLRNARFEPEKLTDVVIDEDTVDLTRVKGVQWAARDFPPSTPPEVQNLMEEDLTEEYLMEEASIEDSIKQDSIKEYPLQNDLPEDNLQAEKPERVPIPVSATRTAASVNPAANQNAPRAMIARKPAASIDHEAADAAKRRQQKRKLPLIQDDEPDSLAKILLQRLGLPLDPEGSESEEDGATAPS
jgi:hypothetical protein